MAELLSKKAAVFTSLHKGDSLEGVVTKLTSQEILVDINAKTEAVVMEKDKRLLRNLLTTLKIGDHVQVSVLNPESDMGHPVVSLRRFLDEISWKNLEKLQKTQQEITAMVTELTRGGYVLTTHEGITGFLPNSHATIPASDTEGSGQLIGKKIPVYVLEQQRASNKVILSQRPVLTTEDFLASTEQIKIGEKVQAVVSNTAAFGIFVTVKMREKSVDGLIHISEISWEKVEDISGMYEVGQTLDAVVIGIDKDARRLDLSIKRLTKDPFEIISKHFPLDHTVTGQVRETTSMGVILELETPDGEIAEGFIRKDKIPPTVNFEPGDTLKATVSQIDSKRQRILLVPVLAVKPIGYR